MIGDQIIPRGYWPQQWMLKSDTNSVTSEQTLWEEEEYIKTNLMSLNSEKYLPNIQYGRIDYSMLNGVPRLGNQYNPGSLRILSNERMERVSGLPISEFSRNSLSWHLRQLIVNQIQRPG